MWKRAVEEISRKQRLVWLCSDRGIYASVFIYQNVEYLVLITWIDLKYVFNLHDSSLKI